MPIPQIFYIDTPSFSTATRVYLDNLLTICAPDGYYSDGSSVRRQSSCLLLPAEVCPTCLPPCGASITASGSTGFYRMEFGTGSTLGAMIIRFNPYSVPDGIRASLSNSSTIYNRVAAISYSGGVESPSLVGNFTIIGNVSQGACIPPGLVGYSEFEYDGGTSSFVSTGNTINYTIDPADVFLAPSDPGVVTMVVPKTNINNNVLTVEILGPCNPTGWIIDIECPVKLTKYLRSVVATNLLDACSLPLNRNYFFVSVAPTPSLTDVGLADFVFNDSNGATALPDGYYKVENAGSFDVIEVLNGNVINLYNCP